MKRPLAFRFVVAWCAFALFLQIGYPARHIRAAQDTGGSPGVWGAVAVAMLAFVVWQVVGLWQLRSVNRWFAVVFHFWYAVMALVNAYLMLQRPAVKVVPVTIFFGAIASFNALTVWYLSRRRFREFAVEFVRQNEAGAQPKRIRRTSGKAAK